MHENQNIIKKIKLTKKSYIFFISIIIAIPTIILILIGCFRYYNLSAPNFDFGIFSNIFYYMKKTLLPLSTCERDYLLSHFAVHFSPILYLILPIYFIFSNPVVLQIMQVIIIFSGIIPIIKIAKHYNLSRVKIIIISILYCFYPALSCGTFFDFHENCFLTPLLLWYIYFSEKENKISMFLSLILVLLVKEDAFIYIIIYSLYIIISKKKFLDGTIMILISFSYFLIVSLIMSKYGLGIMSSRYDNLIYDNLGLLGVIKTIFLNPGYALNQLFSNSKKIIYILKLLLPLSFLPVITKKFSRLILISPILLFTITDYELMYNINFHYSFGVSAFLFYASIINLKDIKYNKKYILSFAIICTLIMYYSLVITYFKSNLIEWNNNKENYKVIMNVLKKIPENSSVNASTFFVPHLSNRKEIYEVYYNKNKLDIDYVILDMRGEDNINIINYYLNNDYKKYIEDDGMLLILKKRILKRNR